MIAVGTEWEGVQMVYFCIPYLVMDTHSPIRTHSNEIDVVHGHPFAPEQFDRQP